MKTHTGLCLAGFRLLSALEAPAETSQCLFLGFFVLNALTAEFAVFVDVESFGIVSLILHGCVVASFALSTSQSDDDAIIFLSHVPTPPV